MPPPRAFEGPRLPGGLRAKAKFVIFLRSIYHQRPGRMAYDLIPAHPRASSRPSTCPARRNWRAAAGQDDEQRGK